jgi:ligand-binding sensor domain-containing protein/signal transduction histidine kinase
MVLFSKHTYRWAAGLLLVLVFLGGCTQTPFARPVATLAPAPAPQASLWTNTFPPIQNKGAALRFVHYSLEEGLSQSSAQTIAQDGLGFLWVGTQDGLNRFDGYSFKVFRTNPNDPGSLSGSEILTVVPGLESDVWVGTSAGLNRYDPRTGRFTHWIHNDAEPDSLISNTVQAIHIDSKDVLWIGTRKGLERFEPGTGKFQYVSMPDTPAGIGNADVINAIHEDQHGTLWIGTNDGLIRYEPQTQDFQRFQYRSGLSNSLSFNEVSSIAEAPDGILWIGTHQGLNRFDPATEAFTQFFHSDANPDTLSDSYVAACYVDRAGQLWLGTRSGLDRFDPSSRAFVHYRNDPTDDASLTNDSIASIYEDRGGMLWVGTNDGGLNLHDRSHDRFSYYHHINGNPDSLSGDLIFPIAPARSGKVWIGTYQTGLNLFDPLTGLSEHFRHDPANSDSLLSDIVISLYLDADNTLWIGTHDGLDRLYPGSPKFYHYVTNSEDPTSIPYGIVHKIFQDQQSTYWVGTAQGIRRFDPTTGQFTKVQARGADAAGLADGPARAIYQDRNGMLWFGTDTHGLFRFDPATKDLEQYVNDPNRNNSLSSNAIMSVFEDSRGILWVSTFGGGLDRYLPEQDAFETFRQEQGLPNDVVYGVLEAEDGSLWMSTNVGISRYDVSSGKFQNFTVKDGLQSNEFDSSAFAEDATGRMYFGGVRGLTVFKPADIQPNPYVPPLALTSITSQDGQAVAADQTSETLPEITLRYPQNSFNISFAALSFSQVERNQYKYRLEGFENDWHTVNSEHQGGYTNLPGGTYTLHVIGSNSSAVWNDAGTTLKVTVVPPFWQTWLFRGFTAIAVVTAALIAFRSRVRGIQAQKTELEKVIFDRTQVLKKQNLDLEALYAADEKMLRVLTQDEVLHAVVDVAVDILQADKSAVFMRVGEHGDYAVRVSRGFRPETVQSPGFAGSQRSILSEVAAGEALVFGDTVHDPRWLAQPGETIENMASENVRSLMYMPIRVQNAVVGVFNVCSSSPGAFEEDRQRLFASLMQRAALSIENSRLFEQTKSVAILEERNRLAQELHDSAKQKAFAALAQLGAAKKLVKQDHSSAAEHVVEAENIVSEVIHDLTFFIQESYPNGLKQKGLGGSLREYAFAWQSRSGIRLDLSIRDERRLSLLVEQVLYRVIQEGLSNIARHSEATRASVVLAYGEHELRVEIGDNGKGFDPPVTTDGLGLQLIHERLESIGGQVDIESKPGSGTVLRIHVPLQE